MKWMRLAARDQDRTLLLARSPCGALFVELEGRRVALTPSGALWLEDLSVLAAGDLHLEKGSAFAARGQLLPPYDTRATLEKLQAEVDRLAPRTLVLMGDTFHDTRALGRLQPDDARRLAGLGRGRTLIWIIGNHDAALLADGGGLLGEQAEEVRLGGLVLRHEPQPGRSPGEVAGHLHPCAKVVGRGRGVRRRAFVTDGARLILPAYGAYAGGLNVLDRAFDGLFQAPPLAGVIGDGCVHPIAFSALRQD
jgi:DNA ligase-associated metallophosphoesterase